MNRSPIIPAAEEDGPCLRLADDGDDLARILRGISRLVLQHPAIMQSVARSLIAEGRQFAATPEGARWLEALSGSELVRGGRALWESSALNLLEDADGVPLPSAVVDSLVVAVTDPDLHRRLPDLMDER